MKVTRYLDQNVVEMSQPFNSNWTYLKHYFIMFLFTISMKTLVHKCYPFIVKWHFLNQSWVLSGLTLNFHAYLLSQEY